MTEEKILERVRKLLNQAEHPNTGEEERDAFYDKAQALMLQHAISEAQIRDGRVTADRKPVTNLVIITAPFIAAKTMLMNYVCETNRCQMFYTRFNRGKARRLTVFGYDDDTKYVEMLFTSLLLQLGQEQSAASKDGRSTGAAWQNAFAHGFMQKVGQRLTDMARRRQMVDGTAGAALVLYNDIVEQFAKQYPNLGKSHDRGPSGYAGYRDGLEAGERADVAMGGNKLTGTQSLPK